jgi:hypothetical protein
MSGNTVACPRARHVWKAADARRRSRGTKPQPGALRKPSRSPSGLEGPSFPFFDSSTRHSEASRALVRRGVTQPQRNQGETTEDRHKKAPKDTKRKKTRIEQELTEETEAEVGFLSSVPSVISCSMDSLCLFVPFRGHQTRIEPSVPVARAGVLYRSPCAPMPALWANNCI